MKASKRSKRASYTPTPAKKRKTEALIPPIRVYYASTFDLLNFSDIQYLNQILSHFPNCHLILGVEDDSSAILSLQEREDSLKKTALARQILSPAPKVSLPFISSYNIQHICTPFANLYSESNIAEYVKVIERPQQLTSHDLISRVLANKTAFVARSLESGFSRQQLGVSLLQELRIKLMKVLNFKKWRIFGRPNLRFLKGYKSLFYREQVEDVVKESGSF